MKLTDHVDKAVQAESSGQPPRSHLGASEVGHQCYRKVWYTFRWVYSVQHGGRLLRLFERGNLEEHRFVQYLRAAGFEVEDFAERLMYHSTSDDYSTIPWEDKDSAAWLEGEDVSADPLHIRRATAAGQGPRQWGFAAHEGHFAGSADGKARAPARLELVNGWTDPDAQELLEFKTHSSKSFAALVSKGVLSSKPQHYVQMQIYMRQLGLRSAIYLAVNKDTDEWHAEHVGFNPAVADAKFEAAGKIIEALSPPNRISEDPSWWICKFCDYREICHYQKEPQKNCRSCAYARPAEGGAWRCERFAAILPKDFIPKGCEHWNPVS